MPGDAVTLANSSEDMPDARATYADLKHIVVPQGKALFMMDFYTAFTHKKMEFFGDSGIIGGFDKKRQEHWELGVVDTFIGTGYYADES